MIPKDFQFGQGILFDRLIQDYVAASFGEDWQSNESLEFTKNIRGRGYDGVTDVNGNYVAYKRPILADQECLEISSHDRPSFFNSPANNIPARMIYRPDGTVFHMSHYKDGIPCDQENGFPSIVEFGLSGNVDMVEITSYDHRGVYDGPSAEEELARIRLKQTKDLVGRGTNIVTMGKRGSRRISD